MRIRRNSGFLLSIIINIVFNLEGSIPAWILLGLHFWLGLSIKWFLLALFIWLFVIFLRTAVLSWVNKQNNISRPKLENKNPYSKTGYKPHNIDKKNK